MNAILQLVVCTQECYTLGGRVSHECHSAHCHRDPLPPSFLTVNVRLILHPPWKWTPGLRQPRVRVNFRFNVFKYRSPVMCSKYNIATEKMRMWPLSIEGILWPGPPRGLGGGGGGGGGSRTNTKSGAPQYCVMRVWDTPPGNFEILHALNCVLGLLRLILVHRQSAYIPASCHLGLAVSDQKVRPLII